MNGNAGLTGDMKCFRQLLHDIETFAPQVDAVVTTIAPDDLGHLGNFVRIFRSLRVPRSGKAERALFHRLDDEAIHLLLFRSIRRPLVESHADTLYLLRRDTRGDVDRYAALHH